MRVAVQCQNVWSPQDQWASSLCCFASSVTDYSNHRDFVDRLYVHDFLLDKLICLASSLWRRGDVEGLQRVNPHNSMISKAAWDEDEPESFEIQLNTDANDSVLT